MNESLKQKIQSLLVEIENLRRHNYFDADTDRWQVPQSQLFAVEKQTKDVLGLLDEVGKCPRCGVKLQTYCPNVECEGYGRDGSREQFFDKKTGKWSDKPKAVLEGEKK